MELSQVTARPVPTVVSADKTGFNSLTAESFLKLLIAQLQNQDPTQPVGNDELLSQLSAMRSLQSNIQLGDSLKAITLNQQLTSGAAFLGRFVVGTGANNAEVSGIVDRVVVRNGQTLLGLGDVELGVDQVTAVGLVPAGN